VPIEAVEKALALPREPVMSIITSLNPVVTLKSGGLLELQLQHTRIDPGLPIKPAGT